MARAELKILQLELWLEPARLGLITTSEIKPPLSKVKAINSDKQSNDVTTQMMMSGDPPFKNHSKILIWTGI